MRGIFAFQRREAERAAPEKAAGLGPLCGQRTQAGQVRCPAASAAFLTVCWLCMHKRASKKVSNTDAMHTACPKNCTCSHRFCASLLYWQVHHSGRPEQAHKISSWWEMALASASAAALLLSHLVSCCAAQVVRRVWWVLGYPSLCHWFKPQGNTWSLPGLLPTSPCQ